MRCATPFLPAPYEIRGSPTYLSSLGVDQRATTSAASLSLVSFLSECVFASSSRSFGFPFYGDVVDEGGGGSSSKTSSEEFLLLCCFTSHSLSRCHTSVLAESPVGVGRSFFSQQRRAAVFHPNFSHSDSDAVFRPIVDSNFFQTRYGTGSVSAP